MCAHIDKNGETRSVFPPLVLCTAHLQERGSNTINLTKAEASSVVSALPGGRATHPNNQIEEENKEKWEKIIEEWENPEFNTNVYFHS